MTRYLVVVMMGPKPTRVTNQIRALRADAGMTQADLARRLGVTRQTVIAIEQGRYSPSLEVAFQIARIFGRPLDDVFDYDSDSDSDDSRMQPIPGPGATSS